MNLGYIILIIFILIALFVLIFSDEQDVEEFKKRKLQK